MSIANRTVFTSLTAEHTFGYELLKFDFKSGIFSIVGANGASKSSLYHALAQGLFNQNPKRCKVDEVNNYVTGQPSVITVEWDRAGSSYRVINSRKEGAIKVFKLVDGKYKDISKKRIPENLKLIAELVGCTYDSFVTLTFQDTSSSIDLVEDTKDSARKEFVDRILNLDELNKLNTRLKDKYKGHTSVITSLERTKSTLQASRMVMKEVGDKQDTSDFEHQLGKLQEQLDILQEQRSDIAGKLGSLREQERLREKVEADEAQLQDLTNTINRFNSAYESPEKAAAAIADYAADEAKLREELAKVEADLKRLVAPVKPKEPATVCSKCGQSLNAAQAVELYERELKEYNKAHTNYTASELALKANRASYKYDLDTTVDALAEARVDQKKWDKLAELKRKRSDLEESLSRYPAFEDNGKYKATLLYNDEELVARITKCKNSIESVTKCLTNAKEYNIVQDTCREFNEQAEAHNTKIDAQLSETAVQIEKLHRDMALLEHLIELTGSKGYRVQKIDTFLATLNTLMKKYSAMLSSGRIACNFFVTEDGKIDFKVVDPAKTMPFSLWSSGEKARVKLSCLFAVLEILETIGATSFNLLFLDEIFSTLDDEGKEGLFEVLGYLSSRGKSVYTISHTPIINPVVFDHVYTARNINGICSLA